MAGHDGLMLCSNKCSVSRLNRSIPTDIGVDLKGTSINCHLRLGQKKSVSLPYTERPRIAESGSLFRTNHSLKSNRGPEVSSQHLLVSLIASGCAVVDNAFSSSRGAVGKPPIGCGVEG